MKMKFVFFALMSVIVFSGCTLERKLAMEFVRHAEYKGAVLVVQPFALDLFNNNEYILDSLYIPDDFPLDSLLFQQTKLLKDVSDSLFLENYVNGFIKTLDKSGFRIFLADELEEFKQFQGPAYIFKFAQVELTEEIYPYVLTDEFEGEEFHKVFESNLLSLNNWFEFEARDTAWRKVFYAEDVIVDNISGELFYDEEEKKPILYYDIDSLRMSDVYQMATDVGDKYASYLVDYLLNTHILKNYPKELKATILFHYDADKKMLFPVEYLDGFEELKIQK